MRTTTKLEPAASSEERELGSISQGVQGLAELSGRIGAHVRRAEVRNRLQRYLQGLLASVERKNGWQLAEALGEPNAHGVQRLLAEADWDEETVRDELRAYVLAHLLAEQAVLVGDATGFREVGQAIGGGGAAGPWDGRAAGARSDRRLSAVRQPQRPRLSRPRALPARGMDG